MEQVVNVLQGKVILLQLSQHVGSHGDIGSVFGGEDQRFVEVLLRFLQLVSLPINESTRIVRSGLKGIAHDSRVAVHLGTSVVAQLYLGYRT